MKCVEFEHGLTLAAPSEGYVRSPGLHMSDLYGSFYRKLDPKRYDKRDKAGKPTPFDLVKMEMGTSFEEVLEPAIRARLFGERPGEFTTADGTAVIFSPDHFFINGEIILGEFKLTWYSSRGFPNDDKFSKWLTQIKVYAHHLQMRKAKLYVLWVNGDYRPPAPKLRAYNLEFTTRELADEWNMLKRHAKEEGLL